MTTNNEFLGTEPIKKLLIKLAAPTVLAQVINVLYNVVDRIYIGQMQNIGALALTGVGLCSPIIIMVSAFTSLVCSGGAPHASMFLGAGKRDEAENTMGSCFALQCIIAVAITTVLLLFNKQIFPATGASEKTLPFAVDYMSVYAWGTFFSQITLGMSAFISAEGFTKISMKSTALGAIANIILDPILIYVLNLGVKGAAIATVISQGLSCIIVLAFLIGNKTVIQLKKETIQLKKEYIMPSITLGTATFVMQITETALNFCFNTSLLKYGGDIAVGALTVMSSITRIVFFPIQGLTQGAQPITSYNYGAGNLERVRESFKTLLTYCLIISVGFWIISRFIPKQLAGIFTNDTELKAYAAKMFLIYSFAAFSTGIQMSCQMTFVALGKSGCSIAVAIVRKIIILIPMIYILPAVTGLGATAVFLAEPVSDILAVAFTAILFSIEFKKALKLCPKSVNKVCSNP